jgi:hypothetical protein
MARSLFPAIAVMGVWLICLVQISHGQSPMTPEEKRAAAAADKVVADFVRALNQADLDALKALYDKDSTAEYTKRNIEYFSKVLKDTKDLKAEFKNRSTQVIGTTGVILGDMRLSAKDKMTGREYFPDYPIPCYVGLDRGFGDSPWHVRVFLVQIDEAAIERRIRAFYDAFAKKDEDKVMATWTTRLTPKALTERREVLHSIFSKAGPIKLVSLEMDGTEVDGDKAIARVKVEVAADEAQTGKAYLAGVMDLDWQMVREGTDWKAVGFVPHKPTTADTPDF